MRSRSTGICARSPEQYLEDLEQTERTKSRSIQFTTNFQPEFAISDEKSGEYVMEVKIEPIKEKSQQELEEERFFKKMAKSVKRNIMFIGAESVGKAQLFQSIFINDERDMESSGNLSQSGQCTSQQSLDSQKHQRKSSNITDKQHRKQSFGDLSKVIDELAFGRLEKRNSVMPGKSLDFYSRTIYNRQLDRNEMYHIWVQNLSVTNFDDILQTVYYRDAQIIVFLFSYEIVESIEILYKSHKKIQENKSPGLLQILVALGSKHQNLEMYKKGQKFSKKCDYFIEIQDFNDTEKIKDLKSKIRLYEQVRTNAKKPQNYHQQQSFQPLFPLVQFGLSKQASTEECKFQTN